MATAKKAPAKKAAAKKAAPVKKATAKKTAPAKKRTPNAAFMKALTPSAALMPERHTKADDRRVCAISSMENASQHPTRAVPSAPRGCRENESSCGFRPWPGTSTTP